MKTFVADCSECPKGSAQGFTTAKERDEWVKHHALRSGHLEVDTMDVEIRPRLRLTS